MDRERPPVESPRPMGQASRDSGVTLLRVVPLASDIARGFGGRVVCRGQAEPFTARIAGSTLVVELAGIGVRRTVGDSLRFADGTAELWREVGDLVRDLLEEIVTGARYAERRQGRGAA